MTFISKKDITDNKDVHGINMYVPRDTSTHTLVLRTTSGTTGVPMAIIKKISFGDVAQYWSEKPQAMVRINPNRALGLQFGLETFFNIQPERENRGLYLGKTELESPYLEDIIAEFKPDLIHATSGFFKVFLDALRVHGYASLSTLKKVLLSGDLPSRSLMAYLKSALPSVLFLRSYAMAEFGKIGLSCPRLNEDMEREHVACTKVHPFEIFKYQIVDQDTTGIGERVISRPGLSNYRTGDRGKLERKKCSCGKELTLTIYGRHNYDVVHCVGATIYASLLEEIFETLSPYVQDFLVEARERHTNIDSVGEITFKIIPTKQLLDMKNPQEFIGGEITSKLLVTKTRTLARLIRDGVFLPPVIEFADALPVMDKKIRVQKID